MDWKMSKMKNEWKTSRWTFRISEIIPFLKFKSFFDVFNWILTFWSAFSTFLHVFYWFARISFVIKILISILIFWSKSLDRDILGRDPSFFFNFKHLSIKIQILGQNSGHFYSMFISTKQQIRQIQDNCEKTGLSLSGHFRFSDLESPNQGKSERLGHLGIPDFGPSKNFGQSSKSRYKVDNF